ncbi:hypothetical protein BDV37DRAFT_246198 [Aspergillus pseudonomiae]|uniref:Uncharacterized protein n=1 Tax=Aspergillus pseudonomiae TaxID=1506151 RepID=A0A5N7DFB8_9EURO|nr:uncharacterized protein BDV37DRAFT_246198 [Aspergillus pseudonomiae]KAE8404969.1 hypothetical protein BDV37DRAFT_246198 [Aspergillus pseudonomiae]
MEPDQPSQQTLPFKTIATTTSNSWWPCNVPVGKKAPVVHKSQAAYPTVISTWQVYVRASPSLSVLYGGDDELLRTTSPDDQMSPPTQITIPSNGGNARHTT